MDAQKLRKNSTDQDPVAQAFGRMKTAYRDQPLIPYQQRREVLQKIESLLLEHDDAICEAVNQDFGGRSFHETKILEIAVTVLGLRHTLKHLKGWMKPQRRKASLALPGARNRVMPQAKGVVGIIAPWNYPLLLSMSPLASAVAAGNRVMIKLASNSQRLAVLLRDLFRDQISDNHVAILPGAPARQFSALPFDHLVFTGSQAAGRMVMATASSSLTPVTLELGGKSPTILSGDFDIKTAAGRILYAKLINSGQTCIAPDYLFVPAGKTVDFTKYASDIVAQRYPDILSKDFTCIIDGQAFQRLVDTLTDAREKGAEIVNLMPGVDIDPETKKIPPMIVSNVTDDMRIMQEEIFGPFLPIMPYETMDEVIDYINSHERPLALYLFSNDRALWEKILANTVSGGVTINDCAMHVAQHDMPFGGVGNSGMGQYHAYEGFVEMSKLKPVNIQSRFPIVPVPPYGKFTERLYLFIKKAKWLR